MTSLGLLLYAGLYMSHENLSVDHLANAAVGESCEDKHVVSNETSDSTPAVSLCAKELERYYAKVGQAEWGC
jgi:hypothetical protein